MPHRNRGEKANGYIRSQINSNAALSKNHLVNDWAREANTIEPFKTTIRSYGTTLKISAMNGEALTVELLLKACADKTVRDNTQKTALDWTITEKHPKVASQLE
jgi:hypothetical protein